jgi:hypothetical protein
VGKNLFIHAHSKIDKKVATEEHKKLAKALPKSIVYTIPADETSISFPDIVFAANGGLKSPKFTRTRDYSSAYEISTTTC